ncbi:hypothetical protein BT69DRAFT_1334719 [Atractiella rhizophila]|nr:hypothetical protein BT69DRAFT_1334719 [Atractiella rhizophila]
MKFRLAVSVIIPFLALFCSVSDATSINNSKVAKALTSASKVIPNGNYYLKNVGTGHYLRAGQRGSAYDIYPSTSKTKIVSKKHNQGTKYIRFSVGQHCFSAQWNAKVDGGSDHAAVMYKCVVDPLKKSSLEKTKQWYTLVPATFGKRSLDDDAEREWEEEDFEDVAEVPEDEVEADVDDDDLDGVFDDEEYEVVRDAHEKRSLEKRGKSVGTFYIVPVDHLKDMATRALTGSSKKTAGGARSTVLQKWKKGNKKQMWQIIKA